MNDYLAASKLQKSEVSDRELIEGLRATLERNYTRMFRAAGQEWERRFGQKDPSDACVTVRVSGSDTLGSAYPRELRLGRGVI